MWVVLVALAAVAFIVRLAVVMAKRTQRSLGRTRPDS